MRRLDGEDWAVMGSIFFVSFMVLMVFGIWRLWLAYVGVGAWLVSMACFGIALYVKDKF